MGYFIYSAAITAFGFVLVDVVVNVSVRLALQLQAI